MNPDDNPELAELIGRVLRAQPLRGAPRSLEARILAELQHRALQPWWRRRFTHWPVAARALFTAACALLARLSFEVPGWFEPASQSVLPHVPAIWVEATLLVAGIGYTALFALLAAAYWSLYANHR